MKKTVHAVLALCLSAAAALAIDVPPDIGARARGAKRIVLATVTGVDAVFGENDFGDRLILSRVTLKIDETMKGVHEATVVVTIEGGTVGDTTLAVSDMPRLNRGERAVLFLQDSDKTGHVPHGRGAGVLRLDADDRVIGASISLADIRAVVRSAQNEGGR